MANTYSQIYIQIVFSVKDRANLISRGNKDELCKYITGIVRNRGQKLICINGMPDHVHIFVGMSPDVAVSDLVRDVKHFSTLFMNEKKWFPGKFCWQEGFGEFSYSHSQIDRVVKYIQRQEEHHRKSTFREEYIGLLKRFSVQYDERYLFKWIEQR